MESIVPFEFNFQPIHEFTVSLSNWIFVNPVTLIKFINVDNASNIVTFCALDKEYMYNAKDKLLFHNDEPMQSYNNKQIEDCNLEDVLNMFNDICEQTRHINRNTMTFNNQVPVVLGDDVCVNIDPSAVEIESLVQNIRRDNKGTRTYYIRNGDIFIVNINILSRDESKKYSISFEYNTETDEFGSLSFQGPAMPEKLYCKIMIKDWSKSSKAFRPRVNEMLQSVMTSEPHIESELDFNQEASLLYDFLNIGLDAYEWITSAPSCDGSKTVEYATVLELLCSIRNKMDRNIELIESMHLNCIYPLVHYYFASDNIVSFINNVEIYVVIKELLDLCETKFELDISKTIINTLQDFYMNNNDCDFVKNYETLILSFIISKENTNELESGDK